MSPSRETIQRAFIRLCRDSRFSLEPAQAAILTGMVLDIDPLIVWVHGLDFNQMIEIANGTHPAVRETAHV